MTGNNPMDRFAYSTREDALEIIERFGGLERAMRDVLGDPYAGCKDGDVCLIDSGNGDAAAVIYRGSIVARVNGGLRRLPLNRAKLIWCT